MGLRGLPVTQTEVWLWHPMHMALEVEAVCSGFMPLYVSLSFAQTESNIFASLSDEHCLNTKRKAHWKGLVLEGPAEDILQCPYSRRFPHCGAVLSVWGLSWRARPGPWALEGLRTGPVPVSGVHSAPTHEQLRGTPPARGCWGALTSAAAICWARGQPKGFRGPSTAYIGS